MENESQAPETKMDDNTSTPNQSSVNPVSTPNQTKKKVPIWVWLLSGCLIISILSIVAVFLLGWLGFRKAKHEFNNQKPQFEQLQKDFEKAAKDAEEWEKKSEEMRNSMPNPEDMNYQITIPQEETSVN